MKYDLKYKAWIYILIGFLVLLLIGCGDEQMNPKPEEGGIPDNGYLIEKSTIDDHEFIVIYGYSKMAISHHPECINPKCNDDED